MITTLQTKKTEHYKEFFLKVTNCNVLDYFETINFFEIHTEYSTMFQTFMYEPLNENYYLLSLDSIVRNVTKDSFEISLFTFNVKDEYTDLNKLILQTLFDYCRFIELSIDFDYTI